MVSSLQSSFCGPCQCSRDSIRIHGELCPKVKPDGMVVKMMLIVQSIPVGKQTPCIHLPPVRARRHGHPSDCLNHGRLD